MTKKNKFQNALENAVTFEPDEPTPLYRELGDAPDFPVDSLGKTLSQAVYAIQDHVRCPLALSAQSVLAVAAIAAQQHINIQLPSGGIKPVSLYLLTVGESGERKSSSDKYAMAPIQEYEASIRDSYKKRHFEWKNQLDMWEKKRKEIIQSHDPDCEAQLNRLGMCPSEPLQPIFTCEEPTYGALCKILEKSHPGIGIFSDEGGEFIGGHAMKDDSKTRTITGLSRMWDGSDIKRIRITDGNSLLIGKRLSVHLMTQPNLAQDFLSDDELINQGFLSRFLFTHPASTMGSRLWQEPSDESVADFREYKDRLKSLLNLPVQITQDGQNSLVLRLVSLSSGAKVLWTTFYNHIEIELQQFGELRPIAGFANKLCENAMRMAAIIAFIENPAVRELSVEDISRGIELAQYYLKEAMRLLKIGRVNPQLKKAQDLLNWLQNKWKEPVISSADVLQYGPPFFRDAKALKPVMDTLVDHCWLKLVEPCMVKGKMRKQVFSIQGQGSL